MEKKIIVTIILLVLLLFSVWIILKNGENQFNKGAEDYKQRMIKYVKYNSENCFPILFSGLDEEIYLVDMRCYEKLLNSNWYYKTNGR